MLSFNNACGKNTHTHILDDDDAIVAVAVEVDISRQDKDFEWNGLECNEWPLHFTSNIIILNIINNTSCM